MSKVDTKTALTPKGGAMADLNGAAVLGVSVAEWAGLVTYQDGKGSRKDTKFGILLKDGFYFLERGELVKATRWVTTGVRERIADAKE